MFIASFPAGVWQTNCYLLATEPGAECVIVDPGMDAVDAVNSLVAEHGLKPVAVVLTHGHLDHTFSVTPLCRSSDAACWIHGADRGLLADPFAAMGPDAFALVERLAPGSTFVEPDTVHELTDGASVNVAGLELAALHAPGHTRGSTMFSLDLSAGPGPEPEFESLVLSGDVLFAGSVGRTDLPGGSSVDMLESLRTKVLPLPDAVAILPGHGPQTTMARERKHNPYLQAPYLQAPYLPDLSPRSPS